jgi:hypothetical protein
MSCPISNLDITQDFVNALSQYANIKAANSFVENNVDISDVNTFVINPNGTVDVTFTISETNFLTTGLLVASYLSPVRVPVIISKAVITADSPLVTPYQSGASYINSAFKTAQSNAAELGKDFIKYYVDLAFFDQFMPLATGITKSARITQTFGKFAQN